MVHDPIQSNADETPGKYHDSKPLLFSKLLDEQTEADRDPMKYRRGKTLETTTGTPQDHAEASREESDSPTSSNANSSTAKSPTEMVPREALLKQYLSDQPPIAEYGDSSTDHADPRFYTLQRRTTDDRAYYCLLCEEFQTGIAGTAALVDVGTGLQFDPVSLDHEVLVEAIDAQRRADFRGGTRPVPRLRTPQLEALNQTYQRVVENHFNTVKEHAESEYREASPIEILDGFAIATDLITAIKTRVIESTLAPQQRTVVRAEFTRALRTESAIPEWVWRQDFESRYPAIAAIHLHLAPDRSSK